MGSHTIRTKSFWLAVSAAAGLSVLAAGAQGPKADAEFLRKAYGTYATMREASPYRSATWSYLGPTNVSGR